jgi:hypothetical protein
MWERDQPSGGFSVLDGAALVAGAAVAAAHIRRAIDPEQHLGIGWLLLSGTFFWIAVTAAGPFIFLVRRYLRVFPKHPQVGDTLWALLGLPWLLTAIFQTPGVGAGGEATDREMLTISLGLGLVLVSAIALRVVWKTWVSVSPLEASQSFAAPWTNRVGLALAIAWPIQCGLGMVVVG